MPKAAKTPSAETPAEEETEVAVFSPANPLLVLTKPEEFNRFYEDMKRQTDALKPDVSTPTGRKAIASMAHKVARTKTAIDAAGLALTEEARATIAKVNDSRSDIRARLDALKVEVRRPLTEWEEAEEARKAAVDETMERLRGAGMVHVGATAAEVGEWLSTLRADVLDEKVLQDHFPIASSLHEQAIASLETIHARLIQEETDKAELDRLRKEAAERQEREEAAQRERDVEAARVAEEERVEAERMEAERLAEEERAAEARRQEEAAEAERQRVGRAAETARQEAEAEAERIRQERERFHEEELERERERSRRAEEDAARQREEREAEQRQRDEEAAEADRQAQARAKDRAHRGQVMAAAKTAIMEHGNVDEAQAKAIVLAITGGNVPHTSITF